MINGKVLNLLEYLNVWVIEAMNGSMLTFPSGTLAEGVYERECESDRTFPEGVFVINDTNIQSASINVQFEIYLVRPTVKTHFEINGRGRFLSGVRVGSRFTYNLQLVPAPCELYPCVFILLQIRSNPRAYFHILVLYVDLT